MLTNAMLTNMEVWIFQQVKLINYKEYRQSINFIICSYSIATADPIEKMHLDCHYPSKGFRKHPSNEVFQK